MKSHPRTGLTALASVTIALAVPGSAIAVISPDEPAHTALVHTLTDPTPSALPPPLPPPSPSTAASAAASANAPTGANLGPQAPRTNLIAVVDPIAVPVRDGFLIRVGARNAGPRSITAPAGQVAATLSLAFTYCCLLLPAVKSVSGCPIGYRFPPNWPRVPAEPYRFECQSPKRTLRVKGTYWESFIFPRIPSPADGVSVGVSGYAQDTVPSDNSRDVVVRLAKPGSGLPVTGPSTISVAGAGLALVIAGTIAIWYGRRRRLPLRG